jgi:hypothetical protein
MTNLALFTSRNSACLMYIIILLANTFFNEIIYIEKKCVVEKKGIERMNG